MRKLFPVGVIFLVMLTLTIFNCSNNNGNSSLPADTTPPETTITSYPSSPTNQVDASFEFICNEDICSYECQLNSADWSPCASPKTYTGLSDGSYIFQVRAWDDSENIDPYPASFSWVIDTWNSPDLVDTPPDTTITSSPSNPSSAGEAHFEFTCDEGTCTYDCQLDSSNWAPCTSPKTYSGLSKATHTFKVRALDESGNIDTTPASYTWTIITYWAKTYGGTNGDTPYSIQLTTEGGYIVAGWTESFGLGVADYWILKLNSDGTIAWQKAYGGTDADRATAIQPTSDGGYIVTGITQSFSVGNPDYWILKLDSDGNVAWQKAYGGTSGDYAFSIQETSGGGYVVAGYSPSFSGGYKYWILKLNPDGTVAWQKIYGGTGIDQTWSIQQTSDGGYIIPGQSSIAGTGSMDLWILKLNSDGTVAWQKTYGGTGTENGLNMIQTSEGGYILAGWTSSFGAGGADFWILKLNSDGTVVWQKAYGGTGSEAASSIQQTFDGGYIVSGATLSFGAGGYDVWILKLNSDGTVVWQKAYGGTADEGSRSIQQTSDGGFIVTGDPNSFGAGGYDFWVLKLNSNGNVIFNPSSGAIMTDTSATVTDTTATVTDTAATVTDTNATVTDTNATVTDTNAIINQQAP